MVLDLEDFILFLFGLTFILLWFGWRLYFIWLSYFILFWFFLFYFISLFFFAFF